jgi:hypothetical protein
MENVIKLVDTTKPMLSISNLLELGLSEAQMKRYISVYQYASKTLKEIENV